MKKAALLAFLLLATAAWADPAVFVDTTTAKWEPVPGVDGALWIPLRDDGGRMSALVKFPAGAIEPPHHHTFGHWIYVTAGKKKVENLTTGQTFTLTPGMYLYTPAGTSHRVTYLTECTFLFATDGKFDMFWDSDQKGVIIPKK